MKALAGIAVIGFLVSGAAHILSFTAVDLERALPSVFLLHIGIFVVWIPAVFAANKLTREQGQKDFLKVLRQCCPVWLVRLCGGLFCYALFNFIFTIAVLKQGGGPSISNGEKVLSSHGRVIKKLTDDEYRRHQSYDIRLFSGHWMIFYLTAALILHTRTATSSDPGGKRL